MKFRISKINLVFWACALILFAPPVLVHILEYALKVRLVTAPFRDEWIWTDSQGKILGQNEQLPRDLRSVEEKSQRRAWHYQKRVKSEVFRNIEKPILVLGRVADSDRVFLNDCEVGSTGLTSDNGQSGWWWSVLRLYPISKECLNTATNEYSNLRIDLYKWAGPSFGIYGGPIGVGSTTQIGRIVVLLDWFRSYFLGVFGLALFFNGIYYFFVSTLTSGRRHYAIFGALFLCISLYELMTSTLPFRIAFDGVNAMRLLFFSAVSSAVTMLWYLRVRFRAIQLWICNAITIGGALILIVALPQSSYPKIYPYYELWFAFFLVVFCLGSFDFIRFHFRERAKDTSKYAFSIAVFLFCCLHDILVTYFGGTAVYIIPYGFVLFGLSGGFALAEEAADAYLYVEEQVGERTKDLRAANEQLKTLEKMKERFFANVSHDFKTPIAVALGAIEETKQQQVSATQMQKLQPAERSLHQLLQMISDLLDTVKAESGTLKVTWENAKPAELLREWISPYEVLCNKKGIELDLDVSGCGALKIPMDVAKIQRVFDNLMSNAVKFTGKKKDGKVNGQIEGHIRVTLRTDEARAYIEVSDSGIGIPAAERDKIFDRYFQSSRTSLREHGGSGIGLSFAKEMIELNNGQLWVEESEWKGSKFVMALPLSQNVEITGEYELQPQIADEALHGSLDVAYPAERPQKIDPTKAFVLVAEDNPEVAQIEVSALAHEYNVFFAPNGEKAFEVLKTRSFDCLVSDIVMPKLRGDELVMKVREEASLRGLPILIVSSHNEETMMVSVLRSGANDYVTKPFRREIFLARVKTQIEAKKIADWISKNEKVIEMGFMAGGLAHQVRNGLNSLRNQVEYLQRVSKEYSEANAALKEDERSKLVGRLTKTNEALTRALQRIERLTDSVHTYSTGSQQQTSIRISDSVKLALELHADAVKRRQVAIETSGIDDLSVLGYAALHEVFVNLIGNAVEAVAEDGSGKITITGKDLGKEIEVSVADNGIGISPEILPRLCQPFFTTKSAGDGTGLGLYIVRDIVEGQHEGKLSIQSEGEGKGATFLVHLPKKAPGMVRDPGVTIHGVPVS